MQTKEYKTIDRSGWPSGPWDSEPDKIQWQDVSTGMPCLIVRGTLSGSLCGYVGVTQDHSMFGKRYSELTVSVHGDLTFADKCQPHSDESRGICHLPDPGEPDNIWWFGFDCAHYNDYSPVIYLMPLIRSAFDSNPEDYRTIEYVKNECINLAKQLKEIK